MNEMSMFNLLESVTVKQFCDLLAHSVSETIEPMIEDRIQNERMTIYEGIERAVGRAFAKVEIEYLEKQKGKESKPYTNKPYLSTAEFAELAGVNRREVPYLCRYRVIPDELILNKDNAKRGKGNGFRFDRERVEAFLAENPDYFRKFRNQDSSWEETK